MHNPIPKSVSALFLICLASLAGGCASIVHGGNRLLTISTQPPGAKATISKLDGPTISVTTTPSTVSLDPKRGYFKGQSYRLKLELPGYESANVDLRAEMSGWYWGNLAFGGLIGMLAVDPVTGSMWNIAPNKIERTLTSSQATLIRKGDGFVVVMVSQLTPAERSVMTKIN